MRTTMLLLVAASALGACKWTDFDDLSKETWVDSTTKPDIKSSDYGVAIQRGARTPGLNDGGRLVVLGAGTASYSELIYNNAGESNFPPTEVGLQAAYNIPNIGTHPIFIADPGSDNTALIVTSENGVAVVFGSQGMLKAYQVFNQDAPEAGTYVLAPGQAMPQPLIAVGDTVFGALLPALPTGTPQPSCKLVDGTAPNTKLQIRALGAVRNGATDDVLAWDASGKLYRYPSTVFNGCALQQANSAVVDTGFVPDPGAEILVLDATTVVLQGHRGDAGYLRVFSSPSPGMLAAVGEATMVAKLNTAAVLEVAGTKYVIAGVPNAIVDGKTAGQVMIFQNGPTGLGTLPVATLNDAQPENNESFGRAVAAMPFNGSQVIAVAAANEIFVYFRVNLTVGSQLYGETRQGR